MRLMEESTVQALNFALPLLLPWLGAGARHGVVRGG